MSSVDSQTRLRRSPSQPSTHFGRRGHGLRSVGQYLRNIFQNLSTLALQRCMACKGPTHAKVHGLRISHTVKKMSLCGFRTSSELAHPLCTHAKVSSSCFEKLRRRIFFQFSDGVTSPQRDRYIGILSIYLYILCCQVYTMRESRAPLVRSFFLHKKDKQNGFL